MPRNAKRYSGKSSELQSSLSRGMKAFGLNMVAKAMRTFAVSKFGLQLSLPNDGIVNLTLVCPASKRKLTDHILRVPQYQSRQFFQAVLRLNHILGCSLVFFPAIPTQKIRNQHRMEVAPAVDLICATFVFSSKPTDREEAKLTTKEAQQLVAMITGISFATIKKWYDNYDIMSSFPDSYYINPQEIPYNPRNKPLIVSEIESILIERINKAVKGHLPLTSLLIQNAAKILHYFSCLSEDDRPSFEERVLFDPMEQAKFKVTLDRYGVEEGLPAFSTTWLRNFMKKNKLSYKVPSNMTKYPLEQLQPQVFEFQATFMTLVTSGVYDLDMIINADQIPCNRSIVPGRVIGIKGSRTYVRAVSGDKARVTAMFAVPMRGPFMIPYLVNRSTSTARAASVAHHHFKRPEDYCDLDTPIFPLKSETMSLCPSLSMQSSQLATGLGKVEFKPTPYTLPSAQPSNSSASPHGMSPNVASPLPAPPPVQGPARSSRSVKRVRSSLPPNSGVSRANVVLESDGASHSRGSLKHRAAARVPVPGAGALTPVSPIVSHRTTEIGQTMHDGAGLPSKRTRIPKTHFTFGDSSDSRESGDDSDSEIDDVSVDVNSFGDPDFDANDSDVDDSGSDYVSDYSEDETEDDDAPQQTGRGISSHAGIQKFMLDPVFREMSLEAQLENLRRLDHEYKTYMAEHLPAPANPSGNNPDVACSPKSVFVTANPKAWFNSDVMISWLTQVILPHRADPNKRILLLIDSCSLHRTQDVRAFCCAHNIDVLFIPPNCTALLRPLDIGINRVLKDHLRKFTVGRIFYEHDQDGHRVRDARYLTEHRYQCALLSFVNAVKADTISNSFRHMVEGSRGDHANAAPDTR